MSQNKKSDLEAQPCTQEKKPQTSTATFNSEYNVPTRTKIAYLGVYFLCNVCLTIYNKAVLGKVRKSPALNGMHAATHQLTRTQFSYPWLLTTLHAGSASIGCYALLIREDFNLTKLSCQENMVLVVFSFLFTINIAISNVSL
jgi:hypothetical protein